MAATQGALFGGVGVERGAVFSEDRVYRYQLTRLWDESLPLVNLVGLNPSRADEREDDRTLARCIDFARRWKFGGLLMTNAFAYCETTPAVMMLAEDPVGPENDRWIVESAARCELVVAAWGVDGSFRGRDREVLRLLPRAVHCLGTTRGGQPRHPLYLPASLLPEPYAPAA